MLESNLIHMWGRGLIPVSLLVAPILSVDYIVVIDSYDPPYLCCVIKEFGWV